MSHEYGQFNSALCLAFFVVNMFRTTKNQPPRNPMRREKSTGLVSAFVCTLFFSLVFIGCQPSPTNTSSSSSSSSSSGAGAKHKLAFVTNNASDFWVIARKGTEKAARDIPDIEVDFKIPADGT